MTIIVADGKLYRPAGCRIPKIGELYIAKTGAVVVRGENDKAPAGGRVIIRQLSLIDETMEHETAWLAALDRAYAGNPIAAMCGPHTLSDLRLGLRASGGFLSTDHAASADGVPVLIINGEAYGPAESAAAIQRAFSSRCDAAAIEVGGLNWDR